MASTQKNASFKPLDLGPTGRTTAKNVARLREVRGLTYKELSEKLTDLKHGIPAIGLRRIEAEARRVTVDDLMALAAALNVSPLKLLFPQGAEPALTGTAIPSDVTLDEALAWARDETNLELGARFQYWQERATGAELEIEALTQRLAKFTSASKEDDALLRRAQTYVERQIERARALQAKATARAELLQIEITEKSQLNG